MPQVHVEHATKIYIQEKKRVPAVEDIDLTELLTNLTRQQMTYSMVLQSSSMIMQLNLSNYL